VSNKTIHDDHPHGVVTLTEVIKYSSNIGSAKLAFKLGPERTLAYLPDFGFSRSTGLNLPGETRGAMRSPNNIKPIELATTAYGHGVTATAVQLAGAVATLANDGMRMEPRLVRAIENRHGEVIEAYPPREDRRVISVESAKQTVRMMETVTEKGGTGTRARIDGYRVAGKTGTAWKHIDGAYSSTARIGSFVGIVPAEAPRLAIAVVVDTPTVGSSYGGIVAGPAFSEIGEGALRVLGVAPDPELLEDDDLDDESTLDDHETEILAATLAPEMTWTTDGRLRIPDLTGLSLRDALSTVQGAGIALSIQGSGRVLHQSPSPGTALATGDRLELQLK
jgi:cell division protein FtsI (penicillin-binding protein 3)